MFFSSKEGLQKGAIQGGRFGSSPFLFADEWLRPPIHRSDGSEVEATTGPGGLRGGSCDPFLGPGIPNEWVLKIDVSLVGSDVWILLK